MVVFSPADKVYTFGSPSVDAVLNKYFGENATPEAGVTGDIIRAHYEDNMRIITPQISDMESLVHDLTKESQAHSVSEKGRPLISNLQLQELENMKHRLETLSSQTYETLKEPLMQVQSHDLATPMDRGSLHGLFSYVRINSDGSGPSGTS
ncbi:unnamed protein product [Cuscuta europaea]|uniref:MADS-box domain-containing protein n=1 Tax=Cuscuta europaea TaxID=41803 RepID=A0A9P1E577_CUSEU|nr:unnamed protein product [Cuscuta europaea]